MLMLLAHLQQAMQYRFLILSNQGTEIANGDFDGAWSSTDNKVTAADAQRIMDYVLSQKEV